MNATARLTMLNSMASRDIVESLDLQKDWGIEVLDLKDAVFGKNVEDLGVEDAIHLSKLCGEKKIEVWTLSSGLFFEDIEKGAAPFQAHLAKVPALIAVAKVLKPRLVRLLIARSSKAIPTGKRMDEALKRCPWLMVFYQEAVDRIAEAGFPVTIENEVHNCLVSTPDEALSFFSALDRPSKAKMTYDIQNLWQEGSFPTLDVYNALKPLIGMVHLKGGCSRTPGGPLVEAASLENASWPVQEILRAVLKDGTSPVICLNPSHGPASLDYKHRAEDYRRDLETVRGWFPGEIA